MLYAPAPSRPTAASEGNAARQEHHPAGRPTARRSRSRTPPTTARSGSCCARPAGAKESDSAGRDARLDPARVRADRTASRPRSSRRRTPSRSPEGRRHDEDHRHRSWRSSPGSTARRSRRRSPTEHDLRVVGVAEPGDDWESSRSQRRRRPRRGLAPGVGGDARRHRGRPCATPGAAVVVVTGTSPNGFMRRIFEAGADDVVRGRRDRRAVASSCVFAVEKAVARRHGTSARETKHDAGELICVLGPKGGTGKTLTTANLAVALADAGHRVAAVDLDLQFGDVGLALGLVARADDLRPRRRRAARSTPTRSTATWPSTVGRRTSCWRRCGPDQAVARHRRVPARALPASCARRYDYVIVDTPPGFTPGGDRDDRRLVARLHGRDARRACRSRTRSSASRRSS